MPPSSSISLVTTCLCVLLFAHVSSADIHDKRRSKHLIRLLAESHAALSRHSLHFPVHPLTKQNSGADPEVAGHPADINWEEVCHELRKNNIGGSGCNCALLPIGRRGSLALEPDTTHDEHLVAERWSKLCYVLCNNNLGEPRCHCSFFRTVFRRPRQPPDAGSALSTACQECKDCLASTDIKTMCNQLCRMGMGGSRCTCAPRSSKKPNSSTVQEHRYIRKPNTERKDAAVTEPDWTEVCVILCEKGDGGSACNCDLIPVGRRSVKPVTNN